MPHLPDLDNHHQSLAERRGNSKTKWIRYFIIAAKSRTFPGGIDRKIRGVLDRKIQGLAGDLEEEGAHHRHRVVQPLLLLSLRQLKDFFKIFSFTNIFYGVCSPGSRA